MKRQTSKGGERLTLAQHLLELRRRLIISVLALMVTTGLSFAFTERLLDLLKRPAPGIDLIYTELPEMIGVYFKVAFLSGIALALPVFVYQLILFVSPGLTPRERRYVFLLAPAIFLAFAAGVAFTYFVLLPPALRFLLTFSGDVARPQIRVSNYVSTITTLLFWVGLVFELPIVIFFLSKIGVVSPAWLSRNRKYALVLAFVLGAIITPTFDPINQALVALPIIVLFEVSIWLSRLAWWGRKQDTGS